MISVFQHFISDASDGYDLLADFSQFLPEANDKNVYGAAGDHVFVTPYSANQLGSRINPSGLLRQYM